MLKRLSVLFTLAAVLLGCEPEFEDKSSTNYIDTPTGVTAAALSATSIRVSWNTVEGATSYNVYRSMISSGPYSFAGSSTSLSLTDTGLSASTTYYYKVSAHNSYGESTQSSSVYATTNGSAPGAPTGVTATSASSNSITVSWTAVTGATGYYVYRAISSSGSYSYRGASTSTSYTDTELSANTAYYYKVAAYNAYGTSEQSSAATIGSAPSAPTGVSATAASSSSIIVSWYSVSGAAEYYIYRATSSSGSYSYEGVSTSTSYTNTGLSENTTYYYKVSAYNNYGESAQSTYVYATTSGSAPSTPTGITATAASSSSITVSWSSTSGATGYYVYRSTSSSGSYSYRGDLTSTSYTDTGLLMSTTYYYKVSAYNSYGTSEQSNYAYATTSGSAPSTPTGVTTTASSSSITVSWSSVSGATGYYVYRSTSSSGSYSYRGDLTSTSYTDTGLSANTTYYYKVSAYNSYGTSGQSNYAYATTTGSAPNTPTGITSVASSSSITISWSSVSGATEYYIYRATSSSGSYSYRGYSTSTSYTDTGLSANTTYYYKVSAYNAYGESAQSSYVYETTWSSTSPAPLTGSSLARGIWRDGEIDGQVVGSQKYYFYATAGASYTVFWNDAWNGDGSKTGIVQVYAYWYSNDEDIFWGDNGEDLGYSYGKTFTASRTGYVMITVELYSYFLYKGGTFAIAYQ